MTATVITLHFYMCPLPMVLLDMILCTILQVYSVCPIFTTNRNVFIH